ncbi:hypothetical protein H072_5455 [Dactylellina haptotyla CBS 200.50]|uniref:Uncharacterized protein n=1 Tax=Dactylellina haptotyla (strain CBS 200.50) TaxID=1284197 RepID=S8ACC8_DACHA|nr:hypothetical protein H072_5455 [Dactylellina haptotyla CBS 200.50]
MVSPMKISPMNSPIKISPIKNKAEAIVAPADFEVYVSPKKKYSDEATHAANEVIKASLYAKVPRRWHWALMDAASGGNVDPHSPEFLEGVKLAASLAEAVWHKYYATPTAKELPRGKKRKSPDSDHHPNHRQRAQTNRPSLVQMADAGICFHLDWNNLSSDVAIFTYTSRSRRFHVKTPTTPTTKKRMVAGPDFEAKENIRPIKVPVSRRLRFR